MRVVSQAVQYIARLLFERVNASSILIEARQEKKFPDVADLDPPAPCLSATLQTLQGQDDRVRKHFKMCMN